METVGIEPTRHSRRELVLVCAPYRTRSLPVRTVRWLADPPLLVMVDACGRRRSPVTMPGYRKGLKPGNHGKKYPATPLDADEFAALLNALPQTLIGLRNRALLIVLRRSGLRISEALALLPGDLDFDRGAVVVQRGKGDKRRISGIDRKALDEINAWLLVRSLAGYGVDQPVFCCLEGPTAGGRLRSAYVRTSLKNLARKAGVTKRVVPHGFRHGLAVELARAKVPMPIVQRQLGHSNLATTANYLQSLGDEDLLGVMNDLTWDAA